MRFLKETTNTFSINQRHTYMVSKDKCQLFSYIPSGQTNIIKFNTPKIFDSRDRTFIETC